MTKFNTTTSQYDTWMFRSTAHFNEVQVNGLSGNDGALYINGINVLNLINSLTGNDISVSYLTSLGVVLTGDLLIYDNLFRERKTHTSLVFG